MHIAVTGKTLFSVSAEKSVQTLNIFICNMGTTFKLFLSILFYLLVFIEL